ncbi:hypothetical protein RJ55_08250 [Drechmeria coniospora]|nr:hypothetical protein RJ55_08250 [Drechmeria coniospora]
MTHYLPRDEAGLADALGRVDLGRPSARRHRHGATPATPPPPRTTSAAREPHATTPHDDARYGWEPPWHALDGPERASNAGRTLPGGQSSPSTSGRLGAPSLSGSTYSIYPPPNKPLPPLPAKARQPRRMPSRESVQVSADHLDPFGASSALVMSRLVKTPSAPAAAPAHADARREIPRRHRSAAPEMARGRGPRSRPRLDLRAAKLLVPDDKRGGGGGGVHHLDLSPSSAVLASKHGNNTVRIWDADEGATRAVIKFSSYTEAQSRSRDYLIRSHCLLSETSPLVAVATRFGRSVDVWDWRRKKCLQTLDDADRWTAGRAEVDGSGHRPLLALYRAADGSIDLYAAADGKAERKPFARSRSICLARAGLPFVPQYPELALSATGPLLVAAAGPRQPRPGRPPPDKETLLVAWDVGDLETTSTAAKPYRVARPWQHADMATAIPSELRAHGSLVVSIWIPASVRAVGGGGGGSLTRVPVPSRQVLVWDLSANSTRTFAIPNGTSCVSPDCRHVAYCHARGAGLGARGRLCILDVADGRELWCWPSRDALAIDSGPRAGFEQFDDLGLVTELAFSADGRRLVIGDRQGRVGVYDVFEDEAAVD